MQKDWNRCKVIIIVCTVVVLVVAHVDIKVDKIIFYAWATYFPVDYRLDLTLGGRVGVEAREGLVGAVKPGVGHCNQCNSEDRNSQDDLYDV